MQISNEWLVESLQRSELSFSKEICDGIKSGEIKYYPEFLSPCSVRQIRSINEFRMRDVEKFERSTHGKRLRREVFEFIDASEKHQNENLIMINLRKEPNEIYGIYVLEGFERIIGAIHFYDKTKTNEADWNKIWNKKGGLSGGFANLEDRES